MRGRRKRPLFFYSYGIKLWFPRPQHLHLQIILQKILQKNRLKISLHKIFQKFQSKFNKKLHNKRIRKTYIYYVYVIRIRIYRTFTELLLQKNPQSFTLLGDSPRAVYVLRTHITYKYTHTATPHQSSPLFSVTTLLLTTLPPIILSASQLGQATSTQLLYQRIRNSTAFSSLYRFSLRSHLRRKFTYNNCDIMEVEVMGVVTRAEPWTIRGEQQRWLGSERQ